MYNVQLEEFCKAYNLGEVIETSLFPIGVANRTYYVETTAGKYVIKAINPAKVKKKRKIKRLEIAEHIAEIANQNGIPSVLAKRINGKFITEFHSQHYIVFDFFEGKVIHLNNITTENCFKVGQVLASLHCVNFKKILERDIPENKYGKKLEAEIDWNDYLEGVSKQAPDWLGLFRENVPLLYEMFELSYETYLNFVPQDRVISHGDVSNLNMMWLDDVPYLIDWETSGFIDATYECLYTAIRFSNQKVASKQYERFIDMDKIYAFLKGYIEKRDLNIKNLEIALYMIYYKRFSILQRNLQKYVAAEDEAERQRTERIIVPFLAMMKPYSDFSDRLEEIKQFVMNLQIERQKEKKFSIKSFFRKVLNLK